MLLSSSLLFLVCTTANSPQPRERNNVKRRLTSNHNSTNPLECGHALAWDVNVNNRNNSPRKIVEKRGFSWLVFSHLSYTILLHCCLCVVNGCGVGFLLYANGWVRRRPQCCRMFSIVLHGHHGLVIRDSYKFPHTQLCCVQQMLADVHHDVHGQQK